MLFSFIYLELMILFSKLHVENKNLKHYDGHNYSSSNSIQCMLYY